jgi:hypothetical protein
MSSGPKRPAIFMTALKRIVDELTNQLDSDQINKILKEVDFASKNKERILQRQTWEREWNEKLGDEQKASKE